MSSLLPTFQQSGFEGQQALTQLLSHSYYSAHLSHAYLFKGPIPLGQKMAFALAKAIFCDLQGCGTCHVCLGIDTHQAHPDLHIIRAESEGQRARIKLNQIHQLVNQVGLPPVQSSHQIFLIEHAENMDRAPANALLKTLEEPASNSIIILLTPVLGDILPTIRSRAQILTLHAETPNSLQYKEQASEDTELWSWQQLEQIRNPQALPKLLEHLEQLSKKDLELQLLIFQRECWEKIKPFIVQKRSVKGLQRAHQYLDLFEHSLDHLKKNTHSKMLIETFSHQFLTIRRQV